jgi:carbamoyltransferase
MITSFDVRPSQRDRIPAVVHADGTARPQIVEEEVTPLYFALLREFGRLTGVECLLNTSFNIKGEPIVCTPREAIRCFFDTGLDMLVIGSFLLEKGAPAESSSVAAWPPRLEGEVVETTDGADEIQERAARRGA